jgi:hypothetical protein
MFETFFGVSVDFLREYLASVASQRCTVRSLSLSIP